MTKQRVTLRFRDGLLLASVMDDATECAVNHLTPFLRVKKGRLSYVELDEATQRWFIDFTPVAGPRFDGFVTYQIAVTAELAYLENHPELLQRINRKLQDARGEQYNSTGPDHSQTGTGRIFEPSS